MAPIVEHFAVAREVSPWTTALIVLGAVTVVTSLALVALVCACCAKKKQKEEAATDEPMKLPERQPEPVPEPVPMPPQEPTEPSAQTAIDPEPPQNPMPSMSVTMKMNQAPDLELMSKVEGPSFAAGVQAAGGGNGVSGTPRGARGGAMPSLMLMEQSVAQQGKTAGNEKKNVNEPSSFQSSASTRGKSATLTPLMQPQPASASQVSVSVNQTSIRGGGASSDKPSSRQVGSSKDLLSTHGGSTVKSTSMKAGDSVKSSRRGDSRAEGRSTTSMRGGGSRGSSINPDLNTSASENIGGSSQRTLQGLDSLSSKSRSRIVAKVK